MLTNHCDNMPASRSPLSQPPKPAHDHPIVKWFLSSPARGISHCFTNTPDTTYTTESERKNKHELGLTPSARREKFLTLFCGFLWAIASVYPSEIPTHSPGTLTHPLTLADQASESTGPSSSLSCRISLTVTFPRLLLTALEPCLSLSSGFVGNIACKAFEWVSHQNRQMNPLTGTHPHPYPQKWMPNVVPHHIYLIYA